MGKVNLEKAPSWYIEKVINGMLPGLQMYVRDVDISDELCAKYVPGMIICERAFTDATCRVGGLAKSHRIGILSNHMANFSDMVDSNEPEAAWGLCVANRDSHFKVLDVFESEDKTLVLLLHLPDNENWHLFENVKLSIEEHLIEDCRNSFLGRLEQKPIPELNTKRWYERLTLPVGFDDELKPWPLDNPLSSRLSPMKNMGFREVYGNVLYIKDAISLLRMEDMDPDYPDAIVYGYIDDQAGLSMQLLCAARLIDDTYEACNKYNDRLLIYRFGSINELDGAQIVDSTLSDYSERITSIDELYKDEDEIEETRKLGFLDSLRNPNYPDDIQAVLVTEKEIEGFELVWMKLQYIDDKTIYARLLNEPIQNEYGVHEGFWMPLTFEETEDGLRAFALADKAICQADG